MQIMASLPYSASAEKAPTTAGVTCACWASVTSTDILTGHEDGKVLHWAANAHAKGFELVGTYTTDALPAHSTGAAAEHAPAATVRNPVVSLHMLLSAPPCVVVHGGTAAEMPQSLSLIRLAVALPSGKHGQAGVVGVPWFGDIQGYALVRPRGSFSQDDTPTGIITLTQGGYLCNFDIDTAMSEAFAPEFQARPLESTLLTQVSANVWQLY